MAARKKQRTTRSSARAAAAEVELLGAGTAHVSLSHSDARKAPALAEALDEKRDAPRLAEAPAEALERLKEFLRRWDGGPLAPAPPWLAPLLDAPPAQLVDLCSGAAALGLADLVVAGAVQQWGFLGFCRVSAAMPRRASGGRRPRPSRFVSRAIGRGPAGTVDAAENGARRGEN